MRPRRILHLIDTGGPGGAETIFLNLVTGLARNRWEPIAVIPEKDWLYDALRQHGVEPLVLPMRRSFDLGYARALLGIMRTQRVAIVQAHLLTSAVYGSLAARVARIPAICTFHGTNDFPLHERFRSAKVRAFDRRTNSVVFVSDALRRAFRANLKLSHASTRVIWNGLEDCERRAGRDEVMRAELGVRPNEILVGAIGNVRPAKAYDVLLRAAAVLKSHGAAFRVVIAGDTRSELYEGLLALRQQLGLEELVTFTGFRSDVARILRALDVFALSSSAEGFSLVTVHAMATGVPVVATRCGGPEDILEDGVTGQLVPCNDPEALAGAILRVASNAAFASRTAEAGYAVSASFTRANMIRAYETVYHEALACHASS